MDKQEFESLKEQLTDHHVKGIGNSCTASPFYLVQVKRTNWGYEQEYAEHHAIYYDDSYWYDVEDFYKDHELRDEEDMEYFLSNITSEQAKEEFKSEYKVWDLDQLWHWLECHYPDHEYTYVHGNDYWETVNWFLTKESAENFLASKGVKSLKYGVSEDGFSRIYIDSLYRSHEIKGLLESVINGNIIWKEV
ncbi:hypothetical protein VPHG_00174 [Vibrio phage 11895-B1]|uniref:hypothetical protein n=1 Tax=Vibrio phage 11895-B1 TaxID=754075 RepID=UPI0002C0F2A5|nr:hypothetical protein VPHG_00174 [Vibrio phage 11895-B1]AGH32237.1 hypothetical protein VPHG_00174 [Vibrio phage 11895-B1]